ncbi:MAG: hypothetical protein AAGF06_00350 [Pseudomonadota bacterium]
MFNKPFNCLSLLFTLCAALPVTASEVQETLTKTYKSRAALDSQMDALTASQLSQNDRVTPSLIPGVVTNTANGFATSLFTNFPRYFEAQEAEHGVTFPEQTLIDTRKLWLYSLITDGGGDKFTVNPGIALGQHRPNPDIPLNNRRVVGVDYKDGYYKPHLPGMRWSADGRIGITSDVGGVDGVPRPIMFRLNKPEALKKPFMNSTPGPQTVNVKHIEIPFSELGIKQANMSTFVNLCDPFIKDADAAPNPRKCGDDDCYTMAVTGGLVQDRFNTSNNVNSPEFTDEDSPLFAAQLNNFDRVFSVPVNIRVSSPKTMSAKIEDVTWGKPSFSTKPTGVLFETVTPGDGRIFIARRNYVPLVWKHTVTGEVNVGNYDAVYSVADPDAKACDASQWSDFYPLSHAPHDPRVNKKYLFAQHPFRGPMGNPIPDGDDMKGTYPWVDKEAKMIMMQYNEARMWGDGKGDEGRYPNRCVYEGEGCVKKDKDATKDQTYFVIGGWTQGKMVQIDNLINGADFKIGLTNATRLSLYNENSALSSTQNKDHEVTVGGTRALHHSEVLPTGSNVPVWDANGNDLGQFWLKNSSILDTIENRLNYNENWKPVTPSDVTWLLSTGSATEEFAFDDYLNQNAFIVSNMVAAASYKNDNPFRITFYDGWHKLLGGFSGQVKVDNSAATLPEVWDVPTSGEVLHGRMEPVANGGVRGKGLWFNGKTHIKYNVSKDQPQEMDGKDWYHSIFIDARELDADQETVLINFPDKSRVTFAANAFKVYDEFGKEIHTFDVPMNWLDEQWFNIGILVSKDKSVRIFANGFPYHDFTLSNDDGSALSINDGGDIVLGKGVHKYKKPAFNPIAFLISLFTGNKNDDSSNANHTTFKGWIDEYKVFSYEPDLETICNFSHGTLVGIDDTADNVAALKAQADLFPSAMHQAVSKVLAANNKPTFKQYICYQNNLVDDRAHLKSLPANTVSVRKNIHFPEGPVFHDAPRPDSSKNEFCLACHVKDAKGGLDLDALVLKPGVNAKDDPRRQPLQPPAKIHGHIPAEFIQSINGNPAAAGSNSIDEYILPSVND